MPVSTLNRVVSLFIVGSAPIAWYILWSPDWITIPLPASQFAVAFVLIPLSAVFGMIAEAIAHFLRECLIKKCAHNRSLARWFDQGRQFDRLKRWQDALERLAIDILPARKPNEENSPQSASEQSRERSVEVNDCAAGIILAKSSRQQVDWVNSFHSAYALASSLAVTVALLECADFPTVWATLNCQGIILELAAAIAIFYFLTVFSVNMYIYTYVIACRYAVIYYLNDRKADAGKKAAPSAVPSDA